MSADDKPDRAGAYRRLVDFRELMLAMGKLAFQEQYAVEFYPGGLEQFNADAQTLRDANREARQPENTKPGQ